MTRLSILLICLLCLLSAVALAQEVQPGKLTVEPYKLKTYDGREHEAELGRLWVRENRDNYASQRLIELAFVRLPSTAKEPGPPIIYLAGGPGIPGIGMGQIPVYFALFERLREVGDVILLDQRGSGLSSPSLNCPAPSSSAPPDILADETRAVQHSPRSCARRSRSSSRNPAP